MPDGRKVTSHAGGLWGSSGRSFLTSARLPVLRALGFHGTYIPTPHVFYSGSIDVDALQFDPLLKVYVQSSQSAEDSNMHIVCEVQGAERSAAGDSYNEYDPAATFTTISAYTLDVDGGPFPATKELDLSSLSATDHFLRLKVSLTYSGAENEVGAYAELWSGFYQQINHAGMTYSGFEIDETDLYIDHSSTRESL